MSTEQPVTDSASQEAAVSKLEAMFGGDEPETPDEGEQSASPESDEQSTEQTEATQDDSEDVDFEGLQLKLPKEAATKLKSAVEGYKDYTRKTQELAEHRRVVTAQEQMLREQQSFQASISTELSQYQAIDSQLAEYRKLDWTQIPMDQAMQYRMQFDALKDKKEQLGQDIGKKRQDFAQKSQAQMRSAAESSLKAVKTSVPNWGDKESKSATKAAMDLGYTDQELSRLNLDPRFILMAHESAQWRALQASKPSVTNRANAAPRVVKPGASTQSSKAIEHMNYRKAVKNAPDAATKHGLIAKRMEQKLR